MKIGVVCYPTLGGSGVVATELGHALALKGHEVHFISYEIPFRLKLENPRIHFHEVDIHQYELFPYPDYALTLAVKIAEVSKDHKLDILHVHYAIPHATSAFLAKQLIEKEMPAIVTTLHGTDITLVGSDAAYFEIAKFSIEKSDAVTAVSNSLKTQTLELFDIKKSIQVIYNFFEPKPEFMGKGPLKSLFVKPEERLILHASNFRFVKKPLDVIKIFNLIKQKIPAKLLLLGAGGGLSEVRRLVQNLHLQHDVFFLGKIPEIDPYVASADLFLLPSSQESFGLAAVEAMGYGVPVVASNVGGLPEVIESGVSGYLLPVGDVEGMANCAVEILKNQEKAESICREARMVVREKFCLSKILPQYEELYESSIKS